MLSGALVAGHEGDRSHCEENEGRARKCWLAGVLDFDTVAVHNLQRQVLHDTAAVGTPIVALFSSQNATIWRPRGERHTVLQTSLPCACFPAGQLPGPCTPGDSYRSYCVRQLSTDQVFAATQAALSVR